MPVGQLQRRRARILILAAAIVPLVIRLALLPRTGVPLPAVHDEFSYLLGADTFASGRLTNPTHPMWVHFETDHVIQQPTYASKYPPGQALLLAAGQRWFGHPWVGVWLGFGAMCAAITWMLLGVLPWRWALVGVGLLWVRYASMHYWLNSYWGGAIPAAGGALLFGAVWRSLQHTTVRLLLVAGFGMALLLITRPYEGMFLCLACGSVLAFGARGQGQVRGWARWKRSARLCLPPAALLLPFVIGLGVYNRAVTGSVVRLPYEVHDSTYNVVPYFVWQPLRPEPIIRQDTVRRCREHEVDDYRHLRTPTGMLERIRRILDLPKIPSEILSGLGIVRFGFASLLVLSILLLLRHRKSRLPLLCLGVGLAAHLAPIYHYEHYAAPTAGLRILICAQGLRVLLVREPLARLWIRRKSSRRTASRVRRLRAGPLSLRRLGRAAPAVWSLGLIFVLRTAVYAWEAPARRECPTFSDLRAKVTAELESQSGRHLVLVRYAPDHDFLQEWVYNRADIDSARIVWAHDLGEDQNRALLDWFADRTVWLLEPDHAPVQPRTIRCAGPP